MHTQQELQFFPQLPVKIPTPLPSTQLERICSGEKGQLNFTGRSWESMERRQPLRAIRAGGSLAVGTIVQRRKGKIVSPFHHQKIKVHILSSDVVETVVLNLLHGGVRHLVPLLIQNQHIQLFLQRFLPLVLHQGCSLQWLHFA